MRISVIRPATRSILLAVICGMMAAAFLHDQGSVDLSFGAAPGGFLEGASTALIGGFGGYAVLFAFRKLRDLAKRAGKR